MDDSVLRSQYNLNLKELGQHISMYIGILDFLVSDFLVNLRGFLPMFTHISERRVIAECLFPMPL